MADDKSLWKRICAGEQSAFEVFFREFAPRLRGFLHVYSGGELEADDILQETFCKSGDDRVDMTLSAERCANTSTVLRASVWHKNGGSRRT
jgi:hypothetical protein